MIMPKQRAGRTWPQARLTFRISMAVLGFGVLFAVTGVGLGFWQTTTHGGMGGPLADIAILSIVVGGVLLILGILLLHKWRSETREVGTKRVEDFPEYFQQLQVDDKFDKIAYNCISRLLYEQRTLRIQGFINLFVGLLLVGATLGLTVSLFDDIGDVYYSSGSTNAVEDCESVYSRAELERALRQSGTEAAGVLLAQKNTCLKNALPIVSDLSKIQESIYGRGRESWTDISATELYRIIGKFLLVVLSQTLTFFFLKLYVGNLSDARYFANEISNIEARLLAIHIAATRDSEALLATIVGGLVSTERNVAVGPNRRPLFGSRDPVVKDLVDVIRELGGLIRAK